MPRICTLDVSIVHLDAPHPHVAPARLEPKLISGADRARPERAGHDRAESGDGEGAIDVEPRREIGARLLDGFRGALERCAKLVEPLARPRTDAHDLGVGDELACLLFGELGRLRVDRVDLRERDDAALDAEQAQDREVLVRLRSRALPRVDDEEEEVDPGGAGDHRAHEALVPGNVDDRQAAPVGKLQRRVAEVDGDPAPLLLRQAVRVLAGERPHEPRLPVVDVPGRTDRERHQRRLTMSRARVVLPEPVDLLERHESACLVEGAGPRISLVGIGGTERLDLQVLEATVSEVLLGCLHESRAEPLPVPGLAGLP